MEGKSLLKLKNKINPKIKCLEPQEIFIIKINLCYVLCLCTTQLHSFHSWKKLEESLRAKMYTNESDFIICPMLVLRNYRILVETAEFEHLKSSEASYRCCCRNGILCLSASVV